mgnify:CR=1 FL=1
MKMDKNTFWHIIDSVNSEVSGSDLEGVLRVTQEKLQAYSPQEIAVWANFLRQYRDLADTKGVFAASCTLNDYMTDDGFMDFRAWLISRGKEVYLAALKDPDSLAELEIPKCTRFELYGYVAYDAYREICEDDVYAEMDANPLTKAQKEDIRAEIEYYPHQITMENAESHLPNLYAKYLRPGQSILLIDYQPSFPRLTDEPKITTELEKLKSAAALIETMTQGRQTMKSCIGGAYISASDDTNFEILMDISTDDSPDDYRITFSSRSRMMGTEMDSNRLRELMAEMNQVYALLLALEMQEFQPSIPEFQEFCEELKQQEQTGPVMGQAF